LLSTILNSTERVQHSQTDKSDEAQTDLNKGFAAVYEPIESVLFTTIYNDLFISHHHICIYI
jgi:hypothetical protein